MTNQHQHSQARNAEHAVFSWTAPEYVQHSKTVMWYAITGLFLAAFTAWAGFTENWTMVAAIIVLAVVYLYLHKYHPPKRVKVEVTHLGIKMGQLFFPYHHIKAFWIIYKHDWKTINFRLTNGYYYDLIIHLEGQDPVGVRDYLLTQIPEWEGKDENFTEVLSRLLKL